jgi:TatD DNase family protein
MIDSHCHLEYKSFNKDRDEVIAAAKKAGVKLIINPASDFSSNERAFKLAQSHKRFIYPCAGIDPISCLEQRHRVNELVGYLEKCTAIGEVGLDYYWSKEKQRQADNFRMFLDLAKEYEKPVIVHARNAMKDTLDILEKSKAERVILHCFSGSRADAKRAQNLGYFVSLATNICYNNSKSLIKVVSLDNILVETDSPYLNPLREGRNEPKNVSFALEKIAKEHDIPFQKIEKITEKNTEKAFGL